MGNINSEYLARAEEKLYKLAQRPNIDPSTAIRSNFGGLSVDTKEKVNHVKFRGNKHSL